MTICFQRSSRERQKTCWCGGTPLKLPTLFLYPRKYSWLDAAMQHKRSSCSPSAANVGARLQTDLGRMGGPKTKGSPMEITNLDRGIPIGVQDCSMSDGAVLHLAEPSAMPCLVISVRAPDLNRVFDDGKIAAICWCSGVKNSNISNRSI